MPHSIWARLAKKYLIGFEISICFTFSISVKRKHPDEYSESEDEFDEDLEGFVVDYLSSGEEEEMEDYDDDYEDYSKHIRNIFGYDRRK